ncbi:MAG: Fe-S cluster assembly ATPase SufC [Clostridium sp.]|jgi:Fe-S cluster assembly ATP-binding protein|uniref:Fe-S cluster assembly ATPase SufC n=1 Tax=Clostridium sp. TaxID=1506 RepID=UPI0025BE4084|nr:Fe-S cluster assembly ATPase SufC [Clostridium sp.]MCH3963103.1 Fe-S cluster assembly ATPase SufC [Clostridium sp.]MCI1716434.1 Fe-S cluster assembly ATPase SufC [Clostridium sp.]MCI1800774.1 Fe-S cluster assembly ATPase SufC [Clostridium sp.]MCI1814571.1 Fe-S cluster assembly ATPase SufC [Clostridium sp.]MCI1871481.1 Fe-S cluster assembly ATPase SufC [Clostridium sp.]
MDNKLLKINNLKTKVGETEILKGLNLEIGKGEVHAIMGPNGAGKSTLVNTIMGHPKYSISSGDILFEGKSINDLKVDERARLGIFMSFQYPEEIQGITVENFLRTAKSAVSGKKSGILAFRRLLKEKLKLLKIDESYSKRYLNVGFSGGEKKKNEILQMAVLEPKLAMLDETDSGLDVDAVRIVSEGVSKLRTEENSVLIITHHNSILEYLKPDYVHILVNGKIVKTGDSSLAEEIEKNGYDAFKALA